MAVERIGSIIKHLTPGSALNTMYVQKSHVAFLRGQC